jgi:hypothetical protein
VEDLHKKWTALFDQLAALKRPDGRSRRLEGGFRAALFRELLDRPSEQVPSALQGRLGPVVIVRHHINQVAHFLSSQII